MEIENNGSEAGRTTRRCLNAGHGAGTYANIETGPIGTGRDQGRVIYKPASEAPVGDHAILDRGRSGVHRHMEPSGNRTDVRVERDRRPGDDSRQPSEVEGSACPGDPDLGDGQGNSTSPGSRRPKRSSTGSPAIRPAAVTPTRSSSATSDYTREDPIDVFIAADYDNLIETYVGPDAYSFVFGGGVGLPRPRPGAGPAWPLRRPVRPVAHQRG